MRLSHRDIGEAIQNELNIPYFDETPVHEDVSDYVVVDGEEGDYGVIRYYHIYPGIPNRAKLIAVYENRGGDEEYWYFTPSFKEKIKAFAVKHIENQIKMTLREIPDQICLRDKEIEVGDEVKIMIENWSKSVLTVPVIKVNDEYFWVRLDSSTTKKFHRRTRMLIDLFKKKK